jgi:pimeloyl-ACP methyl ester carboxylesterase
LPTSASAELRERLQPDRAEVFKGCGHLVMREQPEAINRLIEEFFARQS